MATPTRIPLLADPDELSSEKPSETDETPTPTGYERAIHLLYVPTMFCNLDCSYCYLGEQTSTANLKADSQKAIRTLEFALEKLEQENILAFNVSLHGGEVTTLPPAILEQLFAIIRQYYRKHFDALNAFGEKKTTPHIKTNLYKFGDLYDLFLKYQVSVSASIDLPLRLHDKYRVLKNGDSWRQRTENNLRLLANYPHGRKISATLSHEHLEHLDEIIADIRYLHDEIGFDMNRMNLMFAFESSLNTECDTKISLQPATSEQQLATYQALHQAFLGTDLEDGLRRNWFDEFSPSYCTNAVNCGEKFYLLQSDGNVYSCVRGQGIEEFYYGNIFDTSFSQIFANGANKISLIHQQHGISEDCQSCQQLHHCNTGCAVVKHQRNQPKSYTCDLQKQMYRDSPLSYPAKTGTDQQVYLQRYLKQMHPAKVAQLQASEQALMANRHHLPNDWYESKNTLQAMIDNDPILGQLYRADGVLIQLNDEFIPLSSPLLTATREWHMVASEDKIFVHIHQDLLLANCNEPLTSNIYLQMLSDKTVEYGDEKRRKQAHVFNYQVWYDFLQPSEKDGYRMADISPIIHAHRTIYPAEERLNLFVTTHHLREYHYQKQRSNGFYHIQALNLPFQNFEFYYLT